jgi:predicted XRE-type DNA-binding protein
VPQRSFPDISVPYFEETPAKAGLAHAITAVVERANLTQRAAAGLIGVSLPELRDLRRGSTHGFSVDQLIAFLLRLGCSVEITVRQHRGRLRHGELDVLAA